MTGTLRGVSKKHCLLSFFFILGLFWCIDIHCFSMIFISLIPMTCSLSVVIEI